MTITDLEEFIRGIPLEQGEKETILSALADTVTLEEADPSILSRIAMIAERIRTDLERERGKTAEELEKAKQDLATTMETSRRKLEEFDEKAIAHLRTLAEQAIAEIDRIEEAAAKQVEHKRKTDEAGTIRSLMDKIRKTPSS